MKITKQVKAPNRRKYPTFAYGKDTGTVYLMLAEGNAISINGGWPGKQWLHVSDNQYEYCQPGTKITFEIE